ncbi:MAG: DNA-binding protein [Halothiobacillaceae bacterium]
MVCCGHAQRALQAERGVGRMALTRGDIWAAADRLDAEGKVPTLAAVRKALGSGSFTTISKAMREWHQRRKEKADKVQEAGPVPPDMDEDRAAFMDLVRRHADTEALSFRSGRDTTGNSAVQIARLSW